MRNGRNADIPDSKGVRLKRRAQDMLFWHDFERGRTGYARANQCTVLLNSTRDLRA